MTDAKAESGASDRVGGPTKRIKGSAFTAVRLLWRTRAFVPPRIAVYGVFFFATIGFVATLMWLLGRATGWAPQAVIVAGAAGVYLLGRRYLRR